jgi:hypothetical protein
MAFLSNSTTANSNANTMFSATSSFGGPRASYALCSRQTGSGDYSYAFYDAEFNQLTRPDADNYYGHATSRNSYDGSYENVEQFMYNIGETQTQASSNGTSNRCNATNQMGEYGNSMFNVSERGKGNGYFTRWRTTSTSNIGRQRHAWVNSDHSNKNKVIMFDSGYLESATRWNPFTTGTFGVYPGSERKTDTVFANNGTLGATTSDMTTGLGNASYNQVRKELIIAVNKSDENNKFYINIFKNIDFDATDCDVTLVPSTPDNQFIVTLGNWQTSNTESRHNINVILTDNGQIYISVMHPSSQFNLHRITRASGDASGTVEDLQTQGLTTSYGRPNGEEYGQNAKQTRNGNMVYVWCPYYYYGSGMRSYVIDKRNNSWTAGYQTTDGAAGYQPVKYRDDGFMVYFCGNGYAGNYTGSYFVSSISQRAGAAPAVNSSYNWYLPNFPGPNTTNYPGISEVWEYDFQTVLPGHGARY